MCLPHARGGVSISHCIWSQSCTSSPRPWGCFCRAAHCRPYAAVFPTPVGVFLGVRPTDGLSRGLPHARGGVSNSKGISAEQAASSPRPWGCFSTNFSIRRWLCVFPTPVGVFLFPRVLCLTIWGLPHARGGVSSTFYLVVPGL